MDSTVIGCAVGCSALLVVWLLLSAWPGSARFASLLDRVCAANFAVQALTSVVVFRYLVVHAGPQSGPLPVFVFLGAPIGGYLAWLGWRLARERERA